MYLLLNRNQETYAKKNKSAKNVLQELLKYVYINYLILLFDFVFFYFPRTIFLYLPCKTSNF